MDTAGSSRPLLDRVVDRAAPEGPARDLLAGRWLGHALHPMLTDLPIGFWTSAFVLDFAGARRRPAADLLVALGVVSALPAVITGAVDLRERPAAVRRLGLTHAACNLVATGLYAGSWVARRRDRRSAGLALALCGATAASLGGAIGGKLAFEEPEPGDRPGDLP